MIPTNVANLPVICNPQKFFQIQVRKYGTRNTIHWYNSDLWKAAELWKLQLGVKAHANNKNQEPGINLFFPSKKTSWCLLPITVLGGRGEKINSNAKRNWIQKTRTEDRDFAEMKFPLKFLLYFFPNVARTKMGKKISKRNAANH